MFLLTDERQNRYGIQVRSLCLTALCWVRSGFCRWAELSVSDVRCVRRYRPNPLNKSTSVPRMERLLSGERVK